MRILSLIAMGFVLFVSGGATCARRPAITPFPPPPVVFSTTPSLEEVVAVINRTANVQQLSTNSASVEVLSMPNVPRLSATMNLQRDRRFRLRASLPIVLGAGMDMGSNEEVFWFEVPEGISKTLYYARHEQYRQQLNRAILPVDPTWMMDAIGLVQIDPTTVVAGPVTRQDGKLEIRNTMPMPSGIYQRVCFIEPNAGYVTDQFLYDPSGKLVAQSKATNHVYYAPQQCALPHQVEMNLLPTVGPALSMRIDISSYTVNQLLSGDPNLFTMPQSASQQVDLTTLSGAASTSSVMSVPGISGTLANLPHSTAPVTYRAEVPSANPIRGM